MVKLNNINLILLISYLLIIFCNTNLRTSSTSFVNCQRSLLHWKRDLEYRLNFYLNQKETLNSILESSIYPSSRKTVDNSIRFVRTGGNVLFSDLIIPTGSLIFNNDLAKPTMRLLRNKTDSYVTSKMSELFQVKSQLELTKRQLDDPNQRYIYKGVPPMSQQHQHYSAYNIHNRTVIPGVWSFKQFNYGHVIDSEDVDLKQVNYTNVEQVLAETYMENQKFGLRDSHSRLFFEGKKTFWHSVFRGKLKSGCCDRLKPLHTNRMMTRMANQDIQSPIILHNIGNNQHQQVAVAIRRINVDYLFNRMLTFSPIISSSLDVGLLQSPIENLLQLNNLINIRQPNQPEIFKTIVFKDLLLVDDANLAYSFGDNRLLIGFATQTSRPFDLSHDNYLLKYSHTKTNFTSMQQVAGRIVIYSESHFLNGLEPMSINMVENFNSFVTNNIVRTNKPTIIRGPIQFNALPSMFNHPLQISQKSLPINPNFHQNKNVPIMRVSNQLQVGSLNGMKIPEDIILFPPSPAALRPLQPIVLRGSRQFSSRLIIKDFLNVRDYVNGMRMPQDVIPLHMHDSMGSIGIANLIFIDGIKAVNGMTIQGGKFDDILLKDAYGDAQSLIMTSVFNPQPDGSQIIRAPLRVVNLRVFGSTPDTGLVNGIRPEHLLEFSSGLNGAAMDSNQKLLYGRKTFLKHVEATDCIFNDINHLTNWTNHLIRIDRPDTVQIVYKKLAFSQPPIQQQPPANIYQQASSININRLNIDFYPNQNPALYMANLNFSPEFYILQQSLQKAVANHTEGRYRVLERVQLLNGGRINGIDINDIVTLDTPFRFGDRFTLVGKVEVKDTLRANRINSNYPIDAMDLIQFDKYRIPIMGPKTGPIKLNNMLLSTNNRVSFIQCPMLNGISFTEFANSIMSLTRPQAVDNGLVFNGPVNLEGLIRTESSFNGVKKFNQFANNLKNAKYSFENGMQCNSVIIKT